MDYPGLTVVIPVAPGDLTWRPLLDQIPPQWPVVIAATTPAPSALPATVDWLHGALGRGRQLNSGARHASRDWLWFLHADSRLDDKAAPAVASWCQTRPQGLGYLDLAFDSDGPWLTRLNAWGANLRSRLWGLPYGDQGLCVSRAEFFSLDGFREDLERGEDLDFVVRARQHGLQASRIPALIRTSARRYRDEGWLRTTWRHQLNARRLIRDAGRPVRTRASK